MSGVGKRWKPETESGIDFANVLTNTDGAQSSESFGRGTTAAASCVEAQGGSVGTAKG